MAAYISAIMSRRISAAPGKAFIWFMAVAVALLVEGLLLHGPQGSSLQAVVPPSAASVTSVAEPDGCSNFARVVHVATVLIKLSAGAR